uniref:tRNA-guanine(15) transglycosylase n=1 Tax=uncultured marine crenarchaeote KM3-153-F8 TaxID=526665 RepID=B3V656_9ARCH|nr:archaeosine-tRNA ribosyltransferase type 1 [uncultured marine crenarchaeote KM3-153-F8]
MFEITKTDLDGRIGKIDCDNGSIETPTLLPVIHPVNQIVNIKTINEIGFSAVMTNAYITLKNYGEEAIEKGIHKIINFEGPIMTDSGGYQVLEYGKVDAEPIQMAKFQESIKTNFANVLDHPTSLKDSVTNAKQGVNETLSACEQTLENISRKSIWIGPVQGGKYLDLVEFSAKKIAKMNFDMYALGSPTEIMESYNYKLLAKMIITAKKYLPVEKPLHLFGLGHPLPLSLAVALGCDTFDSASYILYAKDGRYFTDMGTKKIDELDYLPCVCKICVEHTVKEIKSLAKIEKTRTIAIHNLYMLWKEIQSTKLAIKEGRLWEYIGNRTRIHPKLWDSFIHLSENEFLFENKNPRFKKKGIFFSTFPDNRRPEVLMVNNKIKNFLMQNKNKIIIILPLTQRRYSLYNNRLLKKLNEINIEALIGYIIPPFGFIPYQLTDIYPISQMEISENMHNESNTIKQTIEFIDQQFKIIKPKHIYLVTDESSETEITKFIINRYSPKKILKNTEEITKEIFDI